MEGLSAFYALCIRENFYFTKFYMSPVKKNLCDKSIQQKSYKQVRYSPRQSTSKQDALLEKHSISDYLKIWADNLH